MPILLALSFATIIGFLDLHTDDTPLVAILVLVSSYAVARLARTQLERWTLPAIIAASIVVAHTIARITHYGSAEAQDLNIGMIIPFIPAYLGAAAASLVRQSPPTPNV